MEEKDKKFIIRHLAIIEDITINSDGSEYDKKEIVKHLDLLKGNLIKE